MTGSSQKILSSNTQRSFVPKKRYGQNFLIDPNVVNKIIQSCQLKPTDTVLEIGPGKGALTRIIAPHVKKVLAVETDPQLVEILNKEFDQTNCSIIHEDILKYKFENLPNNTRIIGNLPYNICTPIITKVLKHKEKFQTFYMTVQLEYGERIAAQPSTKNYGTMSLFVQYHSNVDLLFKIKKNSFKPVPKVESCFIKLDILKSPKKKPLCEKTLFQVIHLAFGQRRKTIHNTLSGTIGKTRLKELLENLNISPKDRAENISLNDYIRIADAIVTLKN